VGIVTLAIVPDEAEADLLCGMLHVVAFPTNRDNRAQVELVTHGRACDARSSSLQVDVRARISREPFEVNPAIAEPVSPTE